MSNYRRSLESDYECHPISIEKLSASNPSGISLLLQQEHEQQEKNDQENKPINAFVVTSRPSITYTQSDSMLSDSYRSPSCYGDNTGQKKSDWQADSQSYSMSVPYGDDDMMHSYVDTYTLSRTPSSNFYDNQSDYEVILDDGTRQKRTVSLTTVQLVPSQQQDDRTINTEDIPETQTNDRR
jgi:hypothetical protein